MKEQNEHSKSAVKHPVSELEKMWLVEWLEVKKHSRILYLRLRDEDVDLYDIQSGDKIRVQLQVIKKGSREEKETEHE